VVQGNKKPSNDPDPMTLLFDTREPDPHPWERHPPEGWRIERGTIETGDIALARLPEGVVIKRKTPSDLALDALARAESVSSGNCVEVAISGDS
jgi:hypothetical protein